MGIFGSICDAFSSDEACDDAHDHCSDLADQYDGADQSAEVYGDCMGEALWEDGGSDE